MPRPLERAWIAALTSFAALTSALSGCDLGPENYVFQRKPPAPEPRGPVITLMVVAPLETDIDASIVLSAEASTLKGKETRFRWNATGGTISQPDQPDTQFTCKVPGYHKLSLTVSAPHTRSDSLDVTVICRHAD